MKRLAALATAGVTMAGAVSVIGLPTSSTPRAVALDPAPLVPAGAPTRVEVDVARQVLFVWSDGQPVKILPVSTGSGLHYCEKGGCGVAVTPLGDFRAERRIAGLHRSPLGVLYNPVF